MALKQMDNEMDNLFDYNEQPAAVAEPKDEGVDELKAMLALKVRRPQHSRAKQRAGCRGGSVRHKGLRGEAGPAQEEEVQKLQKQQTLLCAKVKQLDEAMMEL